MDKLTHSAMYGINETISSIEDFLDIKENYYAKTNFSGITNIISIILQQAQDYDVAKIT